MCAYILFGSMIITPRLRNLIRVVLRDLGYFDLDGLFFYIFLYLVVSWFILENILIKILYGIIVRVIMLIVKTIYNFRNIPYNFSKIILEFSEKIIVLII